MNKIKLFKGYFNYKYTSLYIMTNAMIGETFAFQAEINQLLSLIINTFYSNKDIFLRELISNASDAIDKIRYASLTDPSILNGDTELEIKIIPDKSNKTITIQDNGVGMTKSDLVKNLGTIAHSGTRAFLESIQNGEKPDISLIGQFGVGFYSAYLVAKNVKVISKHNDDKQYIWESNATGTFTVSEDESHDQMVRGTKVILEIKDDLHEYLEESKITSIVQKHSQYCSFPIKCQVQREEEIEVEVPDTSETTTETPSETPEETPAENSETKEDKEGDIEDADEDDTKNDVKKEKRAVTKWELLNKQSPIWMRKPEDVKEEEYAAFYKSLSNEWEDHLHVKHFSVDGQIQFKALLYFPKNAPFDMFQTTKGSKRDNIKLYVKKVLIMDETEDLLPEYLSFVKGVVDSDDLPLNVSREMLQQNSIMKIIKRNLIKKCIEMMSDLASNEDKSKWDTFYKAFSKNVKLGVHEDNKNREKLVELLRFHSSKSVDDEYISLKDYVSRMKEGQKKIYYVTAENKKAASSSPFIEKLLTKSVEVLYLVDPMDEYMIQSLRDYDGKELVCCSKDGFELDMTDEEKKSREETVKEWEPVCKEIKNILDSKVISVNISDRLAKNPCVLVSDKYGWSPNMERIMKAQALRANDMMGYMAGRRILEINPSHEIIKGLRDMVEKGKDKQAANIINMLYDTVMLDSGFSLEEPSKYAQKVYRMISLGMSGEDLDSAEDISGKKEEEENSEAKDDEEIGEMEKLD